jgi:RIP metalloprotease RseP
LIFVLSALVLLGVLITAHELGHFLVAKLSNVRVHLFSIGFGKALIKWRRGETEYRIAQFPFGGYVQMAGQDPAEGDGPVDPADVGRSLLDKPPITRMLVYLAGPAMNVLLPFVILIPLYTLADPWEQVPPSVVGAVDRGMPAGAPGKLETGDRIVSIDGERIYGFWQTQKHLDAYDPARGPLNIVVERGPDRQRVEVAVSPRTWSETHSMLRFGTESYKMGFVVSFLAADVAVLRPETPAAMAGLTTLDRVLSVDGVIVPRYLDFVQALAARPAGTTVTLEVERMTPSAPPMSALASLQRGPAAWGEYWPWRPPVLPKRVQDNPAALALLPPEAPPGVPTWRTMRSLTQEGLRTLVWKMERQTLTLTVPAGLNPASVHASEEALGLAHASNCISWVDPKGAAARAVAQAPGTPDGLRSGDCIVDIDGTPHSLADFIGMRLGDKPENPKRVTVRRDGREVAFMLEPALVSWHDKNFGETKQIDSGLLLATRPDTFVEAELVPNEDRLAFAWQRTASDVADKLRETVFSVIGLFSGDVSPKQLSGPLTIAYLAGKQAEAGLVQFLQLMVVISLGLAIFNLVPMPGLDGGHIMVAGIEMIIRRRVPAVVQRRIQAVGFGVIFFLILFVLTQDVGRFLRGFAF